MNKSCYMRFTDRWQYSFDDASWSDLKDHAVTMEIDRDVTSVELSIENCSGEPIDSLRITRDGGAHHDFKPFPIQNRDTRRIAWERYLPTPGHPVTWTIGPVPTQSTSTIMRTVPDPTFTVTRKGD